jgi:hypothetical protein
MWTTELGRTRFNQGIRGVGRDRHQLALTCWLNGVGLKPGVPNGASDQVVNLVAEDAVSIDDFQAVILRFLGISHKGPTYCHNGIQRRLTDMHGEVITEILGETGSATAWPGGEAGRQDRPGTMLPGEPAIVRLFDREELRLHAGSSARNRVPR